MQKNILKSLFFSTLAVFFLACADKKTQIYQSPYTEYLGGEQVYEMPKKSVLRDKIAVLVPEKTIKSYASIIINSSIAYALRQNNALGVKIFLIGTEDEASLRRALAQLDEQGFGFVVAGLTAQGAQTLMRINDENIAFFVPTLHKSAVKSAAGNFYFGGIDYDTQFDRLLALSNHHIASFYDNSSLSNTLNNKLRAKSKSFKTYKIEGDKIDYELLFRRQQGLNTTSVFLNTALVRSAIIISQIRANSKEVYGIYTTQIGYNPTLLNLTQLEDRENLYIASAIANKDVELSYFNETLGHSIDYNWVSYATSVGLDYFYTQFMNPKAKRIFAESMLANQIEYETTIYRALEGSFVSIDEMTETEKLRQGMQKRLEKREN